MANAKGSANPRNMFQGGKNSLLPPKSPFPVISSPYTDSAVNQSIGPKTVPMLNDGSAYHHRTSSESFLAEEQPSWLDDLLDEPETPVRRGHRRSSSDSFAYLDMASMSNVGHMPQLTDERKYDMGLAQLWGSQNISPYQRFQQGSFNIDQNKYANLRNKSWELPLSSGSRRGGTSLRDNNISQGAESSSVPWEGDQASYIAADNQDDSRFTTYETKGFHEKKDSSHGYVASENDTKRAKQQFAQRSRVRKLQYIAELERNVQGLQAEGSEVSAELEFVTQQNLILSMENKALKQRLESLAQEHLIKRLEHEVLEREIGRLRALYQQQQSQQPQQQPLHRQRQSSSTHRRSNSKDLDAQFASLSMRHKEAGAGTDPVTGSIHI